MTFIVAAAFRNPENTSFIDHLKVKPLRIHSQTDTEQRHGTKEARSLQGDPKVFPLEKQTIRSSLSCLDRGEQLRAATFRLRLAEQQASCLPFKCSLSGIGL